jgi:transposase
MGVYDEPKSGRPKKLTQEEQGQALELLRQEPRSIKTTVSKFEAITGKKVSPFTIKRLLKGCGHVWKRVRASVRHKRDEAQF